MLNYLRLCDSNFSLNEAITRVTDAHSRDNELSILHHSADSGWPVLSTHLHSSLLTPTQHHHHTTLPLIEHPHQVSCCVGHWALSNDETFLLLVALVLVNSYNI